MGGLIAGVGASMHRDAQHVWCWHARDRVQLSRRECVRVCDCADLQEPGQAPVASPAFTGVNCNWLKVQPVEYNAR